MNGDQIAKLMQKEGVKEKERQFVEKCTGVRREPSRTSTRKGSRRELESGYYDETIEEGGPSTSNEAVQTQHVRG